MSIRKLIPCLLGLFVLALPPGHVFAEDEAMSFVVFDVSDLVSTPKGRTAPTLGLPSPYGYAPKRPQWRGEDEALQDEQHPFINGDSLVDWIHTTVDPASWEQVGASIEFAGDDDRRLYVRNTSVVITKVRQTIAALRSEASARVRVSLTMQESAANAFPDVGGEVSQRDSASLELAPYARGAFAQTHETRYVRDYEVEIAQGSNIGNPIVSDALGGFVAELIASPTLDKDKVVVEGIVQQGGITGMRTLALGRDEEYIPRPFRSDTKWTHGTVQLPTYDGVAIVMTAVLPRGGEIAIPVAGQHRQRTFRLKADLAGAGDVPSLISIGSITRLLTGGDVYIPQVHLDMQGREFIGVDAQLGFHDQKALRAGNADRVLDLMRNAVKRELWGETIWCEVLDQDRLFLRANATTREQVRAFLRAREQEALRPVLVDVRVYVTEQPFEAGPGKPRPENARLLAGARIPTLYGRRAALIAGTTASYLADYDVEVAQESRIADPQIAQAFDGLAFSIVPRSAPGSRTVSADVDLRLARRTLDEQRHETGTQYHGPIDLVQMDRRSVASTLQMPVDGSYLIDAGRYSSTSSQRIAIEIRLSRP